MYVCMYVYMQGKVFLEGAGVHLSTGASSCSIAEYALMVNGKCFLMLEGTLVSR